MRRAVLHSMFVLCAACGLSSVVVQNVLAQASASTEPPQTGVVLTKLSPPIYRPLARQARIMGDVETQMRIRRDGSIASAEVTSGHPMLKQAALESAQKSTFECRSCSETVTSFSLTYTFESRDDGDCCNAWQRAPTVTESQNHVTITEAMICLCDPSATRWKVRSAKCLYLWKCGFREVVDQ